MPGSPTAAEESPEDWTMTNNNCLHRSHRSGALTLRPWDLGSVGADSLLIRALGANLGCLNLEGGFGSHNQGRHSVDILRR